MPPKILCLQVLVCVWLYMIVCVCVIVSHSVCVCVCVCVRMRASAHTNIWCTSPLCIPHHFCLRSIFLVNLSRSFQSLLHECKFDLVSGSRSHALSLSLPTHTNHPNLLTITAITWKRVCVRACHGVWECVCGWEREREKGKTILRRSHSSLNWSITGIWRVIFRPSELVLGAVWYCLGVVCSRFGVGWGSIWSAWADTSCVTRVVFRVKPSAAGCIVFVICMCACILC